MKIEGRGTVKDETLAVAWYQKAAKKGHVFAQFNLAEALWHGRGVSQDKKEALKWYRKLVKKGHKDLVDEDIIKKLSESHNEEEKETGQ